ncbi:prepilin-type N-terminal cleavage/methylation domain-containing protein [Variovorax sp. ZS18.2.2]|uniref:PulJ/GspJ family protein n=1 Tax=Variovorax sp. ZS18.2.2 TaxID=2971255 RepID=UPI0021519B72|nr:prepilin-type N-terminal cleavage/methylation domain-containing protein [Variovorax sp. ZS18.2.2]MCR6476345.1 prepilin-type N-terminal cleavage/methylation domain-containing protein [Variovorax sp. ZS18.2.2]
MRRRPQAGFTLVEVMIAITIMAVLSVMAWRGLDGVTRANSMLEERTEGIALLLRALDQLDRDIALRATTELGSREIDALQAAADAGTDAAGAKTAAPPAAAELLPPALQVRRQTSLPFFMEIIRAAPAAPGQWQRVQWWQRGNVLYRAAGAASASYPLPAPDDAARVVVLNDVAASHIRAWEPGQGWRNLPTVAPARAGATGLELAFDVQAAGSGSIQTFRRVIPLD